MDEMTVATTVFTTYALLPCWQPCASKPAGRTAYLPGATRPAGLLLGCSLPLPQLLLAPGTGTFSQRPQPRSLPLPENYSAVEHCLPSCSLSGAEQHLQGRVPFCKGILRFCQIMLKCQIKKGYELIYLLHRSGDKKW